LPLHAPSIGKVLDHPEPPAVSVHVAVGGEEAVRMVADLYADEVTEDPEPQLKAILGLELRQLGTGQGADQYPELLEDDGVQLVTK
jgi:hypothetical protein